MIVASIVLRQLFLQNIWKCTDLNGDVSKERERERERGEYIQIDRERFFAERDRERERRRNLAKV